ncbi:hypothetical protein HAX54_004547, partial [Datura stramonium]|nr:hypothetical protein [Datura stramonium]
WIKQKFQQEERVKLRVGVWKCLERINIDLEVHNCVMLRIVHNEQRATVHGYRNKIIEFGRRKKVRLRDKSVSEKTWRVKLRVMELKDLDMSKFQ